jgi:hypothetical protein
MDNNIFSSINSLIGILILLLIIAAVVLVVRAVMAPRVEPPHSEPPIVQQPVVQQAPATSGLEPGWYPDQNDSNLTRYFDGREWTSKTQPRT